jgi:hypothetical protein
MLEPPGGWQAITDSAGEGFVAGESVLLVLPKPWTPDSCLKPNLVLGAKHVHKNGVFCLVLVAHTYNPSFSGGRDQED